MKSQRSRAILVGITFTVAGAVIYASSTGAPARSTGAPGDLTCNQAGCHVGTDVGNQVSITYSEGSNYTPGQRGTFTVEIGDTAGRPRYGFQASARLASNLERGQAGQLHAGSGVIVICEDDRTAPCRDTAPVQFATHSLASGTNRFQFDWTPPGTASGDIRIFVAGNAANGNGQNTGDRIHTSSITLTPRQAGGPRPSISQGGVTDAFNFQPGLAANTWVALFGENLSTETRTWDGLPDFAEGRLPTSLAGVSVTIGGRPAAVYSVSPGQVNVLVPMDDSTGDTQIVLRNANGETTPVTARKLPLLPGFYAPFADSNRRLFVTGRWNDQPETILGKPGVEPRAARAFRPGDIVQFYANGLGPTNPAVAADQFFRTPLALVNTPSIRINDVPVEVLGSALVGSGLYQVNARIPEIPNGDHRIVLEIGGARSAENVLIAIQR